MAKRTSTKERGLYKTEISTALFNSENIRELILGDVSNLSKSEVLEKFKSYVKSHIFIDDTITDDGTYIFYDVIMPSLKSNIKNCQVLMYLICHRDSLEDYSKEGYYGNKSDILSQMVEEALLDESVVNNFGIGRLSLDSIDIYNSTHFYGCVMRYSVPNFR